MADRGEAQGRHSKASIPAGVEVIFPNSRGEDCCASDCHTSLKPANTTDQTVYDNIADNYRAHDPQAQDESTGSKAQQQADAELKEAQAGGPEVVAAAEWLEGEVVTELYWSVRLPDGKYELITLQAHREAIQFEYMNGYESAKHEFRDRIIGLENVIAKKDAALQVCVEALSRYAKSGYGAIDPFVVSDSIAQAKEQLK